MAEKSHIKFGHYRGGDISVPVQLAASQTFYARSGNFVYLSSGYATRCDDGANEIFGHVNAGAKLYSATAGVDLLKCCVDPSAIYRIPVGAGTYVITMQGDTCDIIVDANGIQGADLETADDDVFIIVDGDLENNDWVDVMLNQNERGQSGVV